MCKLTTAATRYTSAVFIFWTIVYFEEFLKRLLYRFYKFTFLAVLFKGSSLSLLTIFSAFDINCSLDGHHSY